MKRNLAWLSCIVGSLCLASMAAADDVHDAARLGNLDELRTLLDKDPSLAHARTGTDETPLHYAASLHRAEAVDLLIEYGADVNAADQWGRTPLHVAATSPVPKLVERLLRAGADPTVLDLAGNSPLHVAARHGRGETIDALLAAGADATTENDRGETALHVLGATSRVRDATREAHLFAIAGRLVDAGGDLALLTDGLPAWQPVPQGEDGGTRDSWTDYSDIGPAFLTYQTTYPDICERHDLGLSHLGRHLWALRISDHLDAAEGEEDEPEFKYISTMHGNEIVGAKMCMNLIDYILTRYETDPRMQRIVNEIDLWIVPLMNPDGYDRSPRTRYNAQGIDLNRNFPEGYYGEPDDPAGRATETQVIMNWSSQHSFVCSANLHTGVIVVNYPFDNDGLGSTFSPTPDEDLFVYISEEYSRHNFPMWTGDWYHGITNGAAWYSIDGGMQDWAYRYKGCNEVTIELSNTHEPSASQIGAFWNDNRESMLAYIETCLIGVRGLVTDAGTGEPLAATVTVEGRDHPTYSDPDVGDYHRMLMPGTYALTFEAEGYDRQTLSGIEVTAGDATRADVEMSAPAEVLFPNGGETLAADAPSTITWSGHPAARFHVQYCANFGEGATTTDGFEMGGLGPEYTTGGDADWYVATGGAHSGSRTARAGNISDRDESWMVRTVGGGDFSFWYRVSSESGWDWFNFYIDGSREIHASGYGTWTYFSTTLPAGDHELRWEYVKDGSQSHYSDTVFIDDVTLFQDLTAWHDVIALTEPGATSTTWTPVTPGPDCKIRVRAVYTDEQYGYWDASDATFTVLAGPNGDYDDDGDVDLADTGGLQTCFGDTPSAGCTAAFDFNTDGAVDLADYPPFAALLDGSGPRN